MEEWTTINRQRLLGDPKLGPLVSPYEIPDAFRASMVRSGILRIDLRYIDGQERGRREQINEDVTCEIGIHSGRILTFVVNVESLLRKSLDGSTAARERVFRERIDEAIESLPSEKPDRNRTNRFGVRLGLQDTEPQILELVQGR